MPILALPGGGRHALRGKPLSPRRRLSAGVLLVVGLGIVFWAGLGGVTFQSAAQAAPVAVSQCNGIATTPGLEVTCDVTVVNNLDLATGASSSTVTLAKCQGAAHAAPTCATPTTTSHNGLTTSVTPCNGSVLGGGGVIICSVHVRNLITGNATVTAATVNQCNGTGQGGGVAVVCDPTASTTNATITQCNGSGNGGDGSVTCTVTPSTQSSAVPVTVNQCIGSGNGGGSEVTCTVSLTNRVIPATVTTPPKTTAPAGGGSSSSAGSGGGSGGGGKGKPGAHGTPGAGGSTPRTTVISAPVLAPPLRHTSSFTPPAGLTGDSAPQTGQTDPLLWGLALGCLTAGLLLIVVRSPQ